MSTFKQTTTVEELSNLIEDSKALLSTLQDLKLKAESNYSCKFFKYLDKPAIIKLILPYLNLKDLLTFRLSCRELNSTVISLSTYVIFEAEKKRKENEAQKKKNEKKVDMHYLNNDLDPNFKGDIKVEIEALNKVKNFLKVKLIESEKIIRVFRNDIDYLKSENKSNVDITNRLTEELKHSRENEEKAKSNNSTLQEKFDTVSQQFEEYKKRNDLLQEQMRKEIEGLKVDKNKLTTAVVQLKKISDDLKKKNIAKAEALKAIKNFFMNSTLLKLKGIKDFENQDTTSSNNNPSDNSTKQ